MFFLGLYLVSLHSDTLVVLGVAVVIKATIEIITTLHYSRQLSVTAYGSVLHFSEAGDTVQRETSNMEHARMSSTSSGEDEAPSPKLQTSTTTTSRSSSSSSSRLSKGIFVY